MAGSYQVQILSDDPIAAVVAITAPDGRVFTIYGNDAQALAAAASTGVRIQSPAVVLGPLIIIVAIVCVTYLAAEGIQAGVQGDAVRAFEKACSDARAAVLGNCPKPQCESLASVGVDAAQKLDHQIAALAKSGWQASVHGDGSSSMESTMSCAYARLCRLPPDGGTRAAPDSGASVSDAGRDAGDCGLPNY